MNNDPLSRYNTIDDVPITLFKLTTGENILAIAHDLHDIFRLEEPMVADMQQDIQSWVLYPWIPFVQQDYYDINKYNVLDTYSVDTDVKALYLKTILDKIEIEIDDTGYTQDTILH